MQIMKCLINTTIIYTVHACCTFYFSAQSDRWRLHELICRQHVKYERELVFPRTRNIAVHAAIKFLFSVQKRNDFVYDCIHRVYAQACMHGLGYKPHSETKPQKYISHHQFLLTLLYDLLKCAHSVKGTSMEII
jgi:hypothetical protein